MRIRTLVLVLIVLTTAGCAYMMPPRKIPLDRKNYLDAISTSWKEQLLTNLVRLRYGDTLTGLEMTSVTTSYELDLGVSVGNAINWRAFPKTTGFHDSTTLGATGTYSDKPSITYVPMRGDELQRTMLEPIPPLNVLKGLRVLSEYADSALPYCVRSINRWQSLEDEEFLQIAKLFVDLSEVGVIRITLQEPVEPKVTKVPDKITVTLIDKRKGTNKDNPIEGPCADDGGKSKQGKNGVDGEDKKKADKSVAFLIVNRDIARSESAKNLKACLKVSLDKRAPHYAERDNLQSCVSNSLWDIGNDPNYANGESLKEYAGKSLDDCARGTNLPDGVREGLQKCETKEEEMYALENLLFYGCSECKKGAPHDKKCATPKGYDVYEIINGNEVKPFDPYCKKIFVQTRSILQTLVIISRLIHVPKSDIDTMVAEDGSIEQGPEKEKAAEKELEKIFPLAARGPFGRLKIHSASELPVDTFVAINYYGRWFYIENTDIGSKIIFSSIAGILSMAETGTATGVPILTLPVQ